MSSPSVKPTKDVHLSENKNFDKLRQRISIPNVTFTYFFTTLESFIFISLFDERTKICNIASRGNMMDESGMSNPIPPWSILVVPQSVEIRIISPSKFPKFH